MFQGVFKGVSWRFRGFQGFDGFSRSGRVKFGRFQMCLFIVFTGFQEVIRTFQVTYGFKIFQ